MSGQMVSLDSLPPAIRDLILAAQMLATTGKADGLAVKPPCTTTLQQVFDAYLAHSPIKMRSKRNNILQMKKVLQRLRNRDEINAAGILLTEIDAPMVAAFQNDCVRRYTLVAERDDASEKIARENAYRSSRSAICQARSIFCRDMLQVYEELGIQIPDGPKRFATAKVKGQLSNVDFKPLPDRVVQDSLNEIELMRADVALYLGFWFAVGAGLRRSEIHFLRWEHIREVAGGGLVIVGGIGKDNRELNQPIMMRAAEAIKPFIRGEGGWVIPQRSDRWAKRLSKWLRVRGWSGKKTIHNLRAYVGSLVFAKVGAVHAARFLRHKDVQVTQKHYVQFHLGVDESALNLL